MQHKPNNFCAVLNGKRFVFVELQISSDVYPGANPGFGKTELIF